MEGTDKSVPPVFVIFFIGQFIRKLIPFIKRHIGELFHRYIKPYDWFFTLSAIITYSGKVRKMIALFTVCYIHTIYYPFFKYS